MLKPLLLTLAFAASLFAQEKPADPAPAERPAEPASAEKPKVPDLPEPLPDAAKADPAAKPKPSPTLLPDAIPLTPGPDSKPGERVKGRVTLKPPTTSMDLDARIRYRQAQSRAANEPTVKAAWDESRAATTDNGKRESLKRYYKLLFGKIRAYDKGVAPLVAERERYVMRRLDQSRVDPSDPLDEEHRLRRE